MKILTTSEYFESQRRDLNKVDETEWDAIANIKSCEASYYVMIRTSGLDQSFSDQILILRQKLIDSYNREFKSDYVEDNALYE